MSALDVSVQAQVINLLADLPDSMTARLRLDEAGGHIRGALATQL